MNENELKFLFARFGLLGIPLAWLCLPLMVAIVIADELYKLTKRDDEPPPEV
jgi:uncharacterized membrane protein